MTVSAAGKTGKYEKKREAILDAAAGLFNRQGLKGATLSDVAQAVGLARNSVTYYYATKEDLAAECLLRTVGVIAGTLESAEGAPDTADRLRKLVRGWFKVLREIETGERPDLLNLFDARSLESEQYARLLAAWGAVFRRMRSFFQARGAPALDVAALDARTHLLSSLLLWVRTWIRQYEVEDYERAAERMIDIMLHGLAMPESKWSPVKERFEIPASIAGNPREEFLIVATQLMNQYGYHGASIDKISAHLKVTKGSFYYHIDRKDDLVAECFQRSFSLIRHAQTLAMERHSTGWKQLCMAATLLTRFQVSAAGPLLRYVALSAVPEEIRRDLLVTIDRSSTRYAGMVADGIIDGSVRPVDSSIAGQLIDGMMNAASDLPRWAPGMPRDAADTLFTRPLLLGLLCPAHT